MGGAPGCITAKVVPSLVTVEASMDEEVIYGIGGTRMRSFVKNGSIDFGLSLHAIKDRGTFCVVETMET